MSAAIGLYLWVLWRNANERTLRMLQLQEQKVPGDSVSILVTVTRVNPTARQLMAQLAFQVYGKIAKDEVARVKQ